MTGRERFLTAISNGKPDRLPCQVHGWMDYYLKTYLGGCDQFQAYERFGMDPVIYAGPVFEYSPADCANWQAIQEELPPPRPDGRRWRRTVTTPGGTLSCVYEADPYTTWMAEPLIKSQRDFEIWIRYDPAPIRVDWEPVIHAKRRIGQGGIVRGGYYNFGQGSCWQSLCMQMGTQEAILAAVDHPRRVHQALEAMLAKQLRVTELGGRIELDLVETGGGAGSNTVISPAMHEEFCLPYDRRLHEALHAQGATVVYHLCGGVMKTLELVARNRADGLETMTPPSMGGDCDLAEARRRVGGKLFFIGGFDQNAGFEKGSPAGVRRMVHDLHACCPEGGYVCCPSDHFFFGDPANIQAFADAARECAY